MITNLSSSSIYFTFNLIDNFLNYLLDLHHRLTKPAAEIVLSTVKQGADLIWLVEIRSRPRYQAAELTSLFYTRSLKEVPAAIPRVMRISCLSTHSLRNEC